ncbi:MAG: potassium transporter KefA [Sphingopyxis sp.]|nr:MAG: potassium transporter KefA [Sphingopyxis sp.]
MATITALLCAVGNISPASAQIPGLGSEETEKPSEIVEDPYNRETPRSMTTAYIGAVASDDFKRAAQYLTLDEEVEPDQAAALAQRLQKALDDGGSLLPFAALSNDPKGILDDSLDPEQEQIGTLTLASGEFPIIAVRTDADSGPLWRISAETLDALPLPEDIADAQVIAPPTEPDFVEQRIAGAPLIDWAKLLLLAGFLFLSVRLVLLVPTFAAKFFSRDPENNQFYRFMQAAGAPLAMYVAVIFFFQLAETLDVSIVARQALTRYAGIVGWIAFVWFLWRLISFISGFWTARMDYRGRARAKSLIVFVRRTLKILLLLVAGIAVLDTLGLDVTTGIAALGIGGIAIALGAQKTVENLVGSISVILDQPIRVGDFCKVGDVSGTVLDIGMRSTRIRTNDRTIVTIPNGDFSSRQIENYTVRDSFLFDPVIGLTYDADAAMVQNVLTAIRKLLADDPDLIDDDARVRFAGFGNSSLDIEIFAHVRADSYPHSLEIQERLMLGIMGVVTGNGADFAFPTRTVHIVPNETDKPA